MSETIEVKVPDIGDFDQVDVIEVLVSPGDKVNKEDSLITLESDKATMEIPSPQAGVVKEVLVKVNDQVSEGTPIITLEQEGGEEKTEPPGEAAQAGDREAPREEAPEEEREETEEKEEKKEKKEEKAEPKADQAKAEETGPPPAKGEEREHKPAEPDKAPPVPPAPGDQQRRTPPHASPAVRQFARELGADLEQITGSGPKGRILKEDVQAHVKQALQQRKPAGAGGVPGLPAMPEVDFSKYGEIEIRALTRIQKRSGPNVHRNWIGIPHVTQFDEADITELEAFRKANQEDARSQGIKLTLTAFLIKASVAVLQRFPQVNASLAADGENLVLKHYYHIGVAVDTEQGLVVPVVRDADRKGLFEIARELGELSEKARKQQLTAEAMQGGSFTISSLGGLGGTGFTPIINAPEAAILGVARAAMKPVYQDGEFVPRLILPFSLAYDHRIVDGADGVRFTSELSAVLGDLRRILL